jgi:hypothetical protein
VFPQRFHDRTNDKVSLINGTMDQDCRPTSLKTNGSTGKSLIPGEVHETPILLTRTLESRARSKALECQVMKKTSHALLPGCEPSRTVLRERDSQATKSRVGVHIYLALPRMSPDLIPVIPVDT